MFWNLHQRKGFVPRRLADESQGWTGAWSHPRGHLVGFLHQEAAILIQATLLQRGLLLSVCTQYFASIVEVWYLKAIYLSYVLLIITYQCFATFYDNKDKNFGEGYKQSSEGNMSWIEKDTTHLYQVGAPPPGGVARSGQFLLVSEEVPRAYRHLTAT